jgi:hypothetical protein
MVAEAFPGKARVGIERSKKIRILFSILSIMLLSTEILSRKDVRGINP